ncbi:hypothetical protein F4779DRAFT_516648 [Xylariaceae sp. FL0662B]|nr:hypothetical protein F4779DRAFT_516648 [Xylariaceae sp. FL0662B]
MAHRSGRHHNRYDDPYIFDDPYHHSASPTNPPPYEYVGTDDPSGVPEHSHHNYSPDPKSRRRPSPARRQARTTSPPRRRRHHRASTPPPPDGRRISPPRPSRHAEPHRTKEKPHQNKRNIYQDLSNRPAVQRGKSFGRQGLKVLGEAAALYAAKQYEGADGRGRSPSRDQPYRKPYHDSPPPRRTRHSRRHSPSPSPSPSPPKRSSRAHDSHDRPHGGRRRRAHTSPPPYSREPDSDYDRGRRRRPRPRSSTYTPSRSPSRHRGRRPKSASSGFRSGMRDNVSKMPDKATAKRWQMAAKAALEAGGMTAFRLRKEPGSWTGEKGAKVATAALGAAAIDAFIDKDPRRSKSTGMRGMAENAISSIVASKLMGVKGSSTRRGKSRY